MGQVRVPFSSSKDSFPVGLPVTTPEELHWRSIQCLTFAVAVPVDLEMFLGSIMEAELHQLISCRVTEMELWVLLCFFPASWATCPVLSRWLMTPVYSPVRICGHSTSEDILMQSQRRSPENRSFRMVETSNFALGLEFMCYSLKTYYKFDKLVQIGKMKKINNLEM